MNKNMSGLTKAIIYLFLAISLVMVGFPLLVAFTGSFKSSVEFLTGAGGLFPSTWRWQNYVEAWETANFGKYTLNSIQIALYSVLGIILTCSMSGYVLSRANFIGKRLLMVLLVVTMFVSGTVTLFPIFLLSKDLGLTSSIWGMVIAMIATAQPMYTIIIYSYVQGISKEIDESAIIDGCGFFRIYWNILFPIAKPIMATTAILQFRDAWNSYMLPLAFTLSNSELRPLTVGVVSLKDQGLGISSWNLMIAGTVISLVPIIVVYLCMNRYFIAGITDGAVKG